MAPRRIESLAPAAREEASALKPLATRKVLRLVFMVVTLVSYLRHQLPARELRVENLLAACSNIGTAHITNGCYRLHLVEWNIGEAAGTVAAPAVRTGQSPRAIHAHKKLVEDLQANLKKQGFELAWLRTYPV
jgi:hypothetical protein